MGMSKSMHDIAQNRTTAMGTFYGQSAGIRPLLYGVNFGIGYGINVVGYN